MTRVKVRDLKPGDVVIDKGRRYTIRTVVLKTVDSTGEDWGDYEVAFVTVGTGPNPPNTQFDPDQYVTTV